MQALRFRALSASSLLAVCSIVSAGAAQEGADAPVGEEPESDAPAQAPAAQAPPVVPAPEPTPKAPAKQEPKRSSQATTPTPEPRGPVSQRKPVLNNTTGAMPEEHARPELAENPELKAAPRDDVNKDDDDGGGLFGPIRLGPMVGVGLPNLLSFGALLKLTRYLGGGINIGVIPTVRVSYYGQAKLNYQEYDVFGRLFPFGGGFFVGAGVGYETVKGTLTDKINPTTIPGVSLQGLPIPNPLSYESSGSVKTMVLTPQIGYFYTTSIGFSIGFDIGAQIPIAPSQIKFNSKLTLDPNVPPIVTSQIKSQFSDPTDQKVRDSLQTIGRTPLPTVNLRVGWLL